MNIYNLLFQKMILDLGFEKLHLKQLFTLKTLSYSASFSVVYQDFMVKFLNLTNFDEKKSFNLNFHKLLVGCKYFSLLHP